MPNIDDKHRVMLSISGVQRDALGEEGKIELITSGHQYEKDGICYIIYKENLIAGGDVLDGSNTMLKLCPEQEYLTLLRHGDVEQKQEFRPGHLSMSSYVTNYGAFDMAVLTNSLLVSRGETGRIAGIDVEYELHIDGRWQSTNTLSITIKGEKDRVHEH